MSVVVSQPVREHAIAKAASRHRRVEAATDRVRRDGRFFRLGTEKFYIKGVTHGPFAPDRQGCPFPPPAQTRRDFEQMCELGANCLRVYNTPPPWVLDLAMELGLKVFVDVAWPKNLEFIGDPRVAEAAREAVREAARACGSHPAVFALSVANEIPPEIVRFAGRNKIEQFIDELVEIAKAEAPQCLVSFANFPTTEYLQPQKTDFVCFNLYLENESTLRNYLARLQNMAGEKPLMLGEYGADSFSQHSEAEQARILSGHLHAVFDEGLAGTCIFSFTDDWFTDGYAVEQWGFGLVRRDRTAKPAFEVVRDLFSRAPHVTELALPMCSVVICSYNGASTVEACLRSMEKQRYPRYEVIFVDDGSTDETPRILGKFPWVRVIRQENMGLSYARNVGLAAAKGEVVAYTDSDCEADEDWLYYLAVSLVRSGHAGIGGPNLIPDEGSWIADCVGLSPGGPTHVMLDDRTAEHVPGCNMAFWRWAANQINGFDPQFRKAGDDVDFIWRLQHQGYSIGFAPSAQVWHYRRNTVKAYLKQQRGYGEAEALLKYKHPDHFNTLGASHWRGRLYGSDQIGVRFGGDVIYHGLFGTGLFQTLYRRPASLPAAMAMSVEWHLMGAFVTLLGLAFPPLLWVAAFLLLIPIALAIVAAIQAPMPRHPHPLSRLLVAYLHFRQPIARGWARYSARLKAKVMRQMVGGYRPRAVLPFDPHDPETLRYWSVDHDRLHLLEEIKREVQAAGWRHRVDSGWAGWDMEIYASRYVHVRLTTATEVHPHRGKLTRVRVEAMMSKFCLILLLGALMMTGLLLMYLWPFSRTAVLLPLTVWTMFLVNRWYVSNPVLGLIDEVAEKAGFVPVLPEEAEATAEAALGDEDAEDLFDGASAV